jgi:hypothetical protein
MLVKLEKGSCGSTDCKARRMASGSPATLPRVRTIQFGENQVCTTAKFLSENCATGP